MQATISNETEAQWVPASLLNILDTAYIRSNKVSFPPIKKEDSLNAWVVMVIGLDRLGKSIAPRFAHRYFRSYSIGIELFLPSLAERLREEGLPLTAAHSFDAAVSWNTPNLAVEELQETAQTFEVFGLNEEDNREDEAYTITLQPSILSAAHELIAYISTYHTIKIGDALLLPISRVFRHLSLDRSVSIYHTGQEDAPFSSPRLLTSLRIK